MTTAQKNVLFRTIFFAALLLIVYWSTLGNRFVWDDLEIIVKNRMLEHLGNLPKLLLYEDRTGEGFTGYYRPVTYISFLFDRAIWELNPVGFNITNVLLHISVSLLFFSVVSALFKNERLSFVATLIFALHPVANETVNFHAGGRNTLLSASFALLSLLFYVRRREIPAIACFTVAIFSKEFALLLPAIFFLYDRNQEGPRRKLTCYLPYLIAIVCYLTLRSFAVAKGGNLLKTMQLSGNLLLIPQLVVGYLKNMLLPIDLKVIYDLQPASFTSVALCSAVVAAVVVVTFVFRKRAEISGGACWFFLFLLPVTGIFPLGSTLMADRYAYFSLLGFSLAAAYLICLACKMNKQAIAVVTAALCVPLAAIDMQRNAIWKDLLPLYTQMTKDAPNRSIGFTNVGMYYYEKGDVANAQKYLEESTGKSGFVTRDALQYLSAIYWETAQYDKALSVLNRMMAAEPENPQPYIMASRIYESRGDHASARIYHDKVESRFPGIEQMMEGRVVSLCREGEKLMAEHKAAEAERKFKEALMMKPDFIPALIDMGGLVAERGDHAKALATFIKAESLDPSNPSVHYNLSMVYDLMGRTGEAQDEMKRFNELRKKKL